MSARVRERVCVCDGSVQSVSIKPLMCLFRYSDFVVHEISKDGKMVRLDDLCVPADVEVRVWITLINNGGHSSF